MTTYEPADVAAAIIAEARGYRIDQAIITVALQKMGVLLVDPASVVTLDPNDVDAAIELLQRANMHMPGVNLRPDAEALCRALRSLLPTPPLPEPNGEFAVVIDESSRVWHRRHNGMWHTAGEQERPWSLIGLRLIDYHGVGCSCGGPGCPGGGS